MKRYNSIIIMKVNIISFHQLLFSGDFSSITLPSKEGQIAILPCHAPLIAGLEKGELRVKNNQEQKSINIRSGTVEVNFKEVNILVDLQ